MSFPDWFTEPDPTYSPDEFNLEENTNVLYVSEIHAFEPKNKKSKYLRDVGEQINEYSQFYDVDRISILGDTGSIKDVEEVLSHVDDCYNVWIVAGDEDKADGLGKARTGWFTQADTAQPFDIENDYKIFDEGYETEVEGHKVQAAHHPMKAKRDETLSKPDPRASKNNKTLDKKTSPPEELYRNNTKEDFLDKLFSVERDSNENKEPVPLNTDADICIYDHVHMPYIRKLYDTGVQGLGGRSHNYQTDSDCMPKRSFHITSFSEELVHALHFDSDKDEIFEHEIFDFTDELEMYFVETPNEKTNMSSYLPLQSRFRSDQIDEESYESAETQPKSWTIQKNTNNKKAT